jgi:hypothetical protein
MYCDPGEKRKNMKNQLTITVPYYDNPEMLQEQFKVWKTYPQDINIVVVDDGSWKVNDEQVEKAAAQGVKLNLHQNSIDIYLENVNAVYDDVRAVRGEMPGSLKSFVPEEIGILVLDVPKKDPVFIDCMKTLLPYCIPGVTVIGLLDYYFYKRTPTGKTQRAMMAPVDFMHENGAHFMHLKDWNGYCSCSFFVYDNFLTL